MDDKFLILFLYYSYSVHNELLHLVSVNKTFENKQICHYERRYISLMWKPLP